MKVNESKMVKAIIGKDVKEAIDDFAKAYANAWDAGTDKAKAMKDVVKGMIKSSIEQFAKQNLQGEVTAFTNYLAEAMRDGILTAAEKAELNRLENDVVRKGEKTDDQLSSLNEYRSEEATPDRSAEPNGIAQASQESIDELSGRMTTIQSHTYSILEEMRIQAGNNQEILTQVKLINEAAMHLQRLETIEKRICSMDSNINDVVLKGIMLKK